MKNKILPLLLASATLAPIAVPRDSQAGLLVSVFTPAKDAGTAALIGAGAGLVITAGAVIYLETKNPSEGGLNGKDMLGLLIGLGAPIMVVTTLLDLDAAMPEAQLGELIQNRYPFIESTEAAATIARAVKRKVREAAANDPYAQATTVRFTADELSDLLSSTSIGASDFETLADDLR